MSNIKTYLVTYYLDDRKPDQAKAYRELCAKLQGWGYKIFKTWGGSSHYSTFPKGGASVDLETTHVFENQWNADINGKGRRVFDWAEDHPIDFSPSIHRGHYLVFDQAMADIRHTTWSCGYCGHQQHEPGDFHYGCMGSAYLEEGDLHLLRLRRVDDDTKRQPLTPAETKALMPDYVQAQTERAQERLVKDRADMIKRTGDAIVKARAEWAGFEWILDRNLNLDNIIYYGHTQRFCFGWRQKVGPEVEARLIEILGDDPPFKYEIECADGRKISN